MSDKASDEDILKILCAEAPTPEIRNCLRKFEIKKSPKLQEASLNTVSKQEIINTLKYLGLASREWDDYKKPTCVRELVCRIRNLFPGSCDLCNKIYCVSKDDTVLLSCEVCRKGLHNLCIQQLLAEEYEEGMSEEDVKKILNPFNLPSFHVLCQACTESKIPKPEDGLKKSAKPQSHDSLQPSESVNKNMPELEKDEDELEEEGEHGNLRDNDEEDKNKEKICRFYKQGNCRFGRKGADCPYDHPQACRKLLKHGKRSPNGCTKGQKCEYYHPRMCSTSITKGECYNNDCKFVHVKNTKRKKESKSSEGDPKENPKENKKKKDESKKDAPPGKTINDEEHFLELIQNVKTEMMDVIETKFTSLLKILAPQNQASPQATLPVAPGMMQPAWMNWMMHQYQPIPQSKM